MVSASLFTFISNLFAFIHNNDLAFGGGINVIIVGDLAQLPPIRGEPVFHSPVCLTQPQRQQSDENFYKILQEIRLLMILLQKATSYTPVLHWNRL